MEPSLNGETKDVGGEDIMRRGPVAGAGNVGASIFFFFF